MNSPCTTSFRPDYAVIPGRTLAETLGKSGMTQTELAQRSGLTRKTINGIINGKEPITPETAIQLEKVFRVPARFWINLQNNYEEAKARLKECERLSAYRGWIEENGIPVTELINRGAVAALRDGLGQLAAVLKFFGVASPEEYRKVWGRARQEYSYRQSKKYQVQFGAVSAWLRLGELAAADCECRPYEKSRFENAVGIIRKEVTGNIAESQGRMIQCLSDCGVAMVFVPGIPGAPIYGATRWLSTTKAVLQMSLRGKDDGHFWFTLFHEMAHILLHGKKDIFLEIDRGQATDKEAAADKFACDVLIPPEEYSQFLRGQRRDGRGRFLIIGHDAIKSFAKDIGVPPGVVVGRLQHERLLDYSHCNDLKVRLGFTQ